MSSIVVRRKRYTRKAYTARRDGKTVRVGKTRVGPSKFAIRDRGKKGKGPRSSHEVAKWTVRAGLEFQAG